MLTTWTKYFGLLQFLNFLDTLSRGHTSRYVLGRKGEGRGHTSFSFMGLTKEWSRTFPLGAIPRFAPLSLKTVAALRTIAFWVSSRTGVLHVAVCWN